jgi:DMSO/TMAO reductase YedYZ molybdopterin-dependent catalytic subunit
LYQSQFNRSGPGVVKRAPFVLGTLVLLFCGAVSASGQSTAPAHASVRVTGKVERPLVVSEADLQAFPRKQLTVTDEKGAPVTYTGVPVVELLQRAGAPLGKQLKGLSMRLFVVVEASDGYQAVFALPEFDPAFTDRAIILADRKNGKAMLSPEGPFRLIVEGEKRHARWVREVTALDVEQAQ